MKRLLLLTTCLAAAGCSDSKVVVQASLAESGQPVADLPVWVLPYDREALLDSLVRDAGKPEPAIPAELLTQLQSLTARERQLAARGDSTLRQARAQREAVQKRIDSIHVARRKWRGDVLAPFDSLARAKESEIGTVALVDTTDARGVARISADEGRMWIYASYVLPDVTLEWNVPVTVRGDSTTVRLTRENAKERRFY
jgi:flagellar biosynthesis regulator FlaF